MGMRSTCVKAIAAIVLGALVLAVLIVSVLIFLKLDNINTTRNEGAVTVPPGGPSTPTSHEATTNSTAPSTSPVTPYPYVYNYDGQFTDKKSSWYAELVVPSTPSFHSLQERYVSSIQSLLDKTFHQAYAYVSFFSNDADHVRVYFVVILLNSTNPHAPSSKSLQIALENGAADKGYEWTPISIDNEEPQPPAPASQDQGWKDAATMFLEAVDISFDPCNNFFAFTCNKWIKSHPLVTTFEIDHFSLLQNKIYARMQQILDSFPTDGSKGPKTLQTAAMFYQSCIRSTSSSINGSERILAILNSLGGWPMIEGNGMQTKSERKNRLIRLLSDYDTRPKISPELSIDQRNEANEAFSILNSLGKWPKISPELSIDQRNEANEAFSILNSLGKWPKISPELSIDQRNEANEAFSILNSLGKWPMMSEGNWNQPANTSKDIFRLMGVLYNNYTVPSLLTPNVDIDWGNVSKNALYIDQAALSIPASIFLAAPDDYVQMLTMTIAKSAITLAMAAGIDVDPGQLFADAGTVAQFEYLLARSSVSAGDRRNQSSLYNRYNVSSATAAWPEIDWATYLEALTENRGVSPESLNPFIIVEPSYQTALNNLLPLIYNVTGARVIYNYLMWRFLSNYDLFAGSDFYKATANLRQLRHPNRESLPPPPVQCVQMVEGLMPWAAGRLYVDAEFTDAERMKADIMVRGILSAFRGQLSGLRWMDDLSKLLSMQKIYNMVKNVAYPDFLKNDVLLDESYAPINEMVARNRDIDFMDLFMALADFQWERSLQSLNAPADRSDFGGPPTMVNAWYAPEMNSINLPAAILNDPFFRADFPMAVNYGALGAVMGHELTHGFDDEGVQFDFDGSLHDWMSSYSKEGFGDMAQCAIEEYSGFCYNIKGKKICVNGKTTQGENIADNGGIKAAYQAYKAYVASNGDEMRLPGMASYTMDQIFFLSFAHVWCSVVSPGYLQQQLLLDPHSPAEVRVKGTLRNFPPFAAAFGCRPGDNMYPRKHCNIW